MEYSVNSISHPKLLLKRLKMDVTCPQFYPSGNDEIDKPDDGSFRSHVSKMIDVLFIFDSVFGDALHILDDFLHGGRARPVVLFNRPANTFFFSIEYSNAMTSRQSYCI